MTLGVLTIGGMMEYIGVGRGQDVGLDNLAGHIFHMILVGLFAGAKTYDIKNKFLFSSSMLV